MASPFQQSGQNVNVVSTKNHVNPWGSRDYFTSVLLRHASTDRNLHVGALLFFVCEHSEVAVETVGGIFAHCAGIDDYHVCVIPWSRHVACLLK